MEIKRYFSGLAVGGFIDFQNRVGSIFMESGMNRFTEYGDWGVFLFRSIIATIFLVHGFKKLHFWKVQYADSIPKHTLMLFRISSLFEVVSAVALFMGFFTHIIIIGLIVIMFGAIYYKQVVWRKNFTGEGGWELDLIMLSGLLLLFFVGSGRYSFDRMIFGL